LNQGVIVGIEKKFVEEAITRHQVTAFLERELDRAGFTRVDIQRTPMVTRIAVEVTTPGRVIGKKGKTIQELTDAISREFHMENPQVSVVETKNPDLEPRLIAKRICRFIEMGKKPRAILHSELRNIMSRGALGGEIIAAGKIAGKGGRSKALRVTAGYMPKAGEPARLVFSESVTAYPKAGAIGVVVSIVLPGTIFPDKGQVKEVQIPNIIAKAEEVDEGTNPDRLEPEPDMLKGATSPPKRRSQPKRK
jgi:small subunit ribosomal protein S3